MCENRLRIHSRGKHLGIFSTRSAIKIVSGFGIGNSRLLGGISCYRPIADAYLALIGPEKSDGISVNLRHRLNRRFFGQGQADPSGKGRIACGVPGPPP
jgi:hypothetical protein